MTQSFYDSLSKVATTGGQQKIFDMLNDPFLDTSGAHSIPGPTKADYASAHRDIVSGMNRYFSNESAAKHTVTPQPTPAPTVAQRAKTVVSEAVRKKSIPKGAYIGGGTALAATAYGAYKYHKAHNKTAGLPMDPSTTLVNGHKFDTDDVRFKQKDITPRVLEQEAPKEKVRAAWGSVKNGIKGNKKLFGAAAAVGGAGCLGAYMVHKNKKGGANET